MDKVIILRNYRQYPTTFTLAENVRPSTYCKTVTFYNKYCKFALGVSKYFSNMLTLGELGRYPILIKQAILGILYWWRLEQETENIILNRAFNTMKKDNQPWLQNIQSFLIQHRNG